MKRLSGLLMLLMMLLFTVSAASANETIMQLHQIALGCADGYLMTDGITTILVDCGTDTDATTDDRPLWDYLAASGIEHVDLYFVTHYHNDHALNLNRIMALYGTPDTVLYGPSESLPERFGSLENGVYRQLLAGDRLRMGAFDIVCVGPDHLSSNGEVNVDSLNFVVTWHEHRAFFSGDYIYSAVKRDYPKEIANVDVLSFPHHGLTPYYISEGTITTANPLVILIPGRNSSPVKLWCHELQLYPQVYSSYHGNIVVLFHEDENFTVETYVEPGQYAGLLHSAN